MASSRIIGIDFGTSTSFVKVKRYVDGKPYGGDPFETKEIKFDGKGSASVPTVVQQAGEQIWYGYDAEVLKPGGTIHRNFKLNLESRDPTEQALAKEMTQKFFQYFHDKYEEQIQFFGESTDEEKTLVSYPAKWCEETRRFMIEAAKKAGFRNVEGMDEATAAIGAVMIQEAPNLQEKGKLQADVPATLLLIDMGAGTTDLALCRYTAGATPKNEIIATWPEAYGNILFGGCEVDELLCKTLTQVLSQSSLPEQFVINFAKMRIGEIKAWKEYTVSETLNRDGKVEACSVLDSIYLMMGMAPPQIPAIDRQSFEKLAYTYLEQYTQLINCCIAHAVETARDFNGEESVDFVVLTGGHSQWYFAKDILTGSLKSQGEVNLPQLKGNKSRVLSLARPQETVSLGLVYSPMVPEMKPKTEGKKSAVNQEIAEPQKLNENINLYGNTCGNILNLGYAAQQGDWIYYRGENSYIYKIRRNGNSKVKINEDVSSCINVIEDWIFYRNDSDKGSIYKIKTDGSNRMKINAHSSIYINASNGWLYYCNVEDNRCPYKIRFDGLHLTKLNNDKCNNIILVGEYIYYQNIGYLSYIYRIDLDGSNKKCIVNKNCDWINVVRNDIYYIGGLRVAWDNTGNLYKTNIGNQSDQKLNYLNCKNINVSGDWIYFRNETDGGKLYKQKNDGIVLIKLCDDTCEWINVVANWVYYETDISKIYRISIYGDKKELVK